MLEGAWVRIEGDLIAALGQGAPPSVRGARVLTLRGKTIIPGLTDTHVHLGDVQEARWKLKLFLAHGITSLKETGNSLGNLAAIRRAIEDDPVAPRLAVSGPVIEGSFSELRFRKAGRETEMLLRDIAAFGVDFIKMYNWVSSDALREIVQFARERNLHVVGHVPLSMTSVAGIDLGMTILEHVRLRPGEVIDDPEIVARYPVDQPFMRRTGFWSHFDGETDAARRTLDAWEKRRDRFFITPTLVVQEATAAGYHLAVADNADLGLVSPSLLKEWKEQPRSQWGDLTPEEVVEANQSTRGMTAFIGLARRRGIRVLTGSDVGMAWVVPGASLHREFELLTTAGFSPVEIIHASTGLAAEALRTTDRGTIAPGKIADLVIVDGHLSTDISAIRRIEQVMLSGRLHERTQLLGEAARLAAAHQPEKEKVQ
jgi:cytosine/adenosine deaminase-related metal-dependent hydrolase